VGTKVGALIHYVDERALDKIGERQGTAELSVTLDPFVHGAGDLDAQWCEFVRGFEFQEGHGGVSCEDIIDDVPTLAAALRGQNSRF
jgi:hypothetical protein